MLMTYAGKRLFKRPIVYRDVAITLFVVATARLTVVTTAAIWCPALRTTRVSVCSVRHVVEPPVLALLHAFERKVSEEGQRGHGLACCMLHVAMAHVHDGARARWA